MVEGTKPILTSLSAKLALDEATAISQQLMSPTAPPKAAPCTLTMVGIGIC